MNDIPKLRFDNKRENIQHVTRISKCTEILVKINAFRFQLKVNYRKTKLTDVKISNMKR